MKPLTDLDGIDGPFERAMSRAEREDRRERACVSVSATTYAKLVAHCAEHGLSIKQVVEALVEDITGTTFQPRRPSKWRMRIPVANGPNPEEK